MFFLNPKSLLILLGSLLLQNPVAMINQFGDSQIGQDSLSYTQNYPEGKNISTGYKAIIKYEDGYLAAGSEGTIDGISVSGKIINSEKFPGENFDCLLSDGQKTIVAGDNGSILISSDRGIFRKVNSGTDKNINSLTLFKGIIIAGTDDGEILTGDGKGSFHKISLAVRGNIVSVSAGTSDCFGATDEGEIIHTTDGVHWDIFDFNQVYAGFYKPCSFTSILTTKNRIAVAGVRDDGYPVLMFSTKGNVWGDWILNYSDNQGIQGYLKDIPNGIFYDDPRDQFFLVCNKGKLMKISSCSHCNKFAELSAKNLAGISGYDNTLMIVGENFYLETINPDWE
jgi:hypothetical protein